MSCSFTYCGHLQSLWMIEYAVEWRVLLSGKLAICTQILDGNAMQRRLQFTNPFLGGVILLRHNIGRYTLRHSIASGCGDPFP